LRNLRVSEVVSESIEDFLSFLREAEQQYKTADLDEKDANDATQDILHAVELNTYNPRKTARLVKTLHNVRRTRREAKETMEVLSPVLAWAEENKTMVKSLERLLGNVRKVERRIQERQYTPRTDILDEK